MRYMGYLASNMLRAERNQIGHGVPSLPSCKNAQVDVELADLVSHLLVEDAASRLDAAQALAHPFFVAETPLHWMLHRASACHFLADTCASASELAGCLASPACRHLCICLPSTIAVTISEAAHTRLAPVRLPALNWFLSASLPSAGSSDQWQEPLSQGCLPQTLVRVRLSQRPGHR